MQRYFIRVAGFGSGKYIYFWKSKGLSDKNITAATTADYSLNPHLSYLVTKAIVEFKRSCLEQDKIKYDHQKIVNIYIVCEINKKYDIGRHPTLENRLFDAVPLTKNTDVAKHKYSGYGIGFDRKGFFSHSSGGTGRNVIIFGADMGSSTKTDNRKTDILILGKGPTQVSGHTLSAEKMYSINFTENKKKIMKKIVNEENSYLLKKI